MTKLIYRNNISEKQNLGYIETKDNQGNDVFLLVNMTYFERISYGNLNSETVFFVDIYEIVKHWKEEKGEEPIYVVTDKKLIWQSKSLRGNFLADVLDDTERSSVTLSNETITECVKVLLDDIYKFGYNKSLNEKINQLIN